MSVLRDIFRALELSAVRYVVVGGVAVALHGYLRATKDLDLVIDLTPDHASKAMTVLTASGLEPRVPVRALDFADPEKRRVWIEEKNMLVFQMIDPHDARRSVDLFVQNPIPFEELWARSTLLRIDDVIVHVAAIDDLITMKRQAGRPQDLADIEELTRLKGMS
jgi:hypothetical protein